jgi:tetratricopeptide (TPR) repeat protein/predicted Ser/Thr protein kinase
VSADDTLAGTHDAATTPRGGEAREVIARGEVIGRYVVLGEIGAGGMGVVHAAYDPELDRKVAIKLLHPHGRDPAAARQRLQREGKAMAKLSHPNVASVYDVGTIEESVWLAMELVAGQTLTKWLAGERRSWREVLDVFVQIGGGLAAAHAEGLLHRDVKPDNVMIEPSGRARILDFGLARSEDDGPVVAPRLQESLLTKLGARPALPAVTRPGAIVGTPSYMAPEQFDRRAIDARADQFAFCVSLWEALYGERPFGGDSLPELANNILEGNRRPPPRSVEIPRWLRNVLHRGLAIDRDARWPSMRALLDALDRGRARSRIAKGLAGIGILALGVGGVFAVHHLEQRGKVAACEAAGAEIDAAWNDERRQALRAGLLATEAGHAATTADKVMPWLDDYAGTWRRARVDACVDATVEDLWDDETLDRSVWCLDERRLELDALVTELADADVETVTRAVQAAASLRRVDPCRDAALLARLPPPPTESRDEAQAVRVELSRASALQQTAAYDEGLRVANEGLARAERLGWPPLVAAARLRAGELLGRGGRYDDAESMQERAYFIAVDAGASEVALAAAQNLAFTVGSLSRRHADGERWSNHAEALRKSLPDPAGLREAEGLNSLGAVRDAMGAYDEAIALYERALSIFEAALDPGHPLIATSLNNVANVLMKKGAYERAATLYERGRAIRENAFGPDHPAVATSINNLAFVRFLQGSYADAAALNEQALSIWERALGLEHPLVAQSLYNLGNVREATGAYGDAAKLHARALAIREKALGAEHPTVAQSLNNLANVRSAAGAYPEATRLHERALEIWEKALGPDHPDVATSLNNVAAVREATGDYATAASLHERALAIREKSLDSEHPLIAVSLNNLARLHEITGEYATAASLHERALAIREKALGPEHPEVATSLNNLANVHEATGKYDEAAGMHERALAIREKALGSEHPDVARTLNNLANVRESLGRYDLAATLHERALAIREKALGPEHPDVATSLNNLAVTHAMKGDYDEAGELYARALSIREDALGPEHPLVAKTLANMARVREATGAHEEAATLLERARSIYEAALGPEHPDVAKILNNLAGVRQTTGALDEATKLHERALAIREKVLGPEHPDVAQTLYNLAQARDAKGEHRDAQMLHQRALDIMEKALGPEHPHVTYPLLGLAGVALAQRRPRDAVPFAERAVRIREAADAQPADLAEARFVLARALVLSGTSRARAVTLAEQARDGFRETEATRRESIAEVEAWLRERAAGR